MSSKKSIRAKIFAIFCRHIDKSDNTMYNYNRFLESKLDSSSGILYESKQPILTSLRIILYYVSKALPVGNAYLFSNRQAHRSRVSHNIQPDSCSDEQNPRSCPRPCKLCRFPPFERYPYGRIIRPDRFRPPNRRR